MSKQIQNHSPYFFHDTQRHKHLYQSFGGTIVQQWKEIRDVLQKKLAKCKIIIKYRDLYEFKYDIEKNLCTISNTDEDKKQKSPNYGATEDIISFLL